MFFPLQIADRPPFILLIEGVRSHEAKKIMKEKMKLGDKVTSAVVVSADGIDE